MVPPPQDTTRHRRYRAHSLAALFTAGALLSTAVLLLPGWSGMDRQGIAITVVLAALGAFSLMLLGRHISSPACHGYLIVGASLIAACQILAGGGAPTTAYAMLYVWVALHSALFFSPPIVAAHLTWTTTVQAVALLQVAPAAGILPQLVMTAGVQIPAAYVVGSLASRLRRQATTDPLTGIGNRRLMQRALDDLAAARSRGRGPHPVCLALLDLDDFKRVNDERGHAEGDVVLTAVAARWSQYVTDGSLIARTGGDEFSLLLRGTDLEGATSLVLGMLADTPEGVGASAGLAVWERGEEVDSVLRRVDAALYSAKGSSGVHVAAAAPTGS